jgi:hypothetical protein
MSMAAVMPSIGLLLLGFVSWQRIESKLLFLPPLAQLDAVVGLVHAARLLAGIRTPEDFQILKTPRQIPPSLENSHGIRIVQNESGVAPAPVFTGSVSHSEKYFTDTREMNRRRIFSFSGYSIVWRLASIGRPS